MKGCLKMSIIETLLGIILRLLCLKWGLLPVMNSCRIRLKNWLSLKFEIKAKKVDFLIVIRTKTIKIGWFFCWMGMMRLILLSKRWICLNCLSCIWRRILIFNLYWLVEKRVYLMKVLNRFLLIRMLIILRVRSIITIFALFRRSKLNSLYWITRLWMQIRLCIRGNNVWILRNICRFWERIKNWNSWLRILFFWGLFYRFSLRLRIALRISFLLKINMDRVLLNFCCRGNYRSIICIKYFRSSGIRGNIPKLKLKLPLLLILSSKKCLCKLSRMNLI